VASSEVPRHCRFAFTRATLGNLLTSFAPTIVLLRICILLTSQYRNTNKTYPHRRRTTVTAAHHHPHNSSLKAPQEYHQLHCSSSLTTTCLSTRTPSLASSAQSTSHQSLSKPTTSPRHTPSPSHGSAISALSLSRTWTASTLTKLRHIVNREEWLTSTNVHFPHVDITSPQRRCTSATASKTTLSKRHAWARDSSEDALSVVVIIRMRVAWRSAFICYIYISQSVRRAVQSLRSSQSYRSIATSVGGTGRALSRWLSRVAAAPWLPRAAPRRTYDRRTDTPAQHPHGQDRQPFGCQRTEDTGLCSTIRLLSLAMTRSSTVS
jgi:hypothetical protein